MATNAADIITIAEYEAWSGDASSVAFDAQVQTWITQASIAAAAYCHCGPSLMVASRVEDLDGHWDADGGLTLSGRPIASITSITLDPYNTPVSIPATDVYNRLGQSTLYLKKSSAFYGPWRGLIQVSYSAGYATAPQDLKLAICLIVQTLFKLSNPARDFLSQKVRDVEEKFNPISWSIEDPVFRQAAELLNQYRIPVCI